MKDTRIPKLVYIIPTGQNKYRSNKKKKEWKQPTKREKPRMENTLFFMLLMIFMLQNIVMLWVDGLPTFQEHRGINIKEKGPKTVSPRN